MSALLTATGLSHKASGKQLLAGVDIELVAGELTVLLGPNGAGKSTLLTLLAGDLRPASGSVRLGDRSLESYSAGELARLRAVMSQDELGGFSFTVEEIVRMGRYPWRSTGQALDHEAAIASSLSLTETEAVRHRLFTSLSAGERARVTLARVLAQEAPILLLDEPTASLDPRHQHLTMRLARRHAASGGAVLAVLHDLNLASFYADRVAVLKGGTLFAHGPPAEVLSESLLEAAFETPFEVAWHARVERFLVTALP